MVGVMRQGTKYETTSVGQVKQNLHTVKCIWNVSTSNISAFQVIPTIAPQRKVMS